MREAADVLAYYKAMHANRRTVSLRMAALAYAFIIKLTQAQGRRERYDIAPPAPFLGRPLTLYVRDNRGQWDALLAPTTLAKASATEWLDRGDSGFFHRPEDWADTRYFDAFSVFCHPHAWTKGAEPHAGIAAWVALLARDHVAVDAKVLRDHVRGLGGPVDFDWSPALLKQVQDAARKVEIPNREPPYIPIRILPYAAERGLGWGEALAFWLYSDSFGPNLTARQAGRLLGVAQPAQLRKMARDAKEKVGEDTLMRFVPAWPKQDADITINEPQYDVPGQERGDTDRATNAAPREREGR